MAGRVVRATERGWNGIEVESYRPGSPDLGVERHTIVGARKQQPSDPGPALELRYFELQPGAASRLEKHEHQHYVIVRRGLGYAILGTAVTEIAAGDVIFVDALELHQFVNRADEPFGFFCVVDACRDFSQQPTDEELAALLASPAGTIAKPFAVPPPSKSGIKS
jgi:quercetin dioxygenase-like cupin family protein